jgi:hypothetical protein
LFFLCSIFFPDIAQAQTFGIAIKYTSSGQAIGNLTIKDIKTFGAYINHYSDYTWENTGDDVFYMNTGTSFGISKRIYEPLTVTAGIGKYRVCKHTANNEWDNELTYAFYEAGCTYDVITKNRSTLAVDFGITIIPGFITTIYSGLMLSITLNKEQ